VLSEYRFAPGLVRILNGTFEFSSTFTGAFASAYAEEDKTVAKIIAINGFNEKHFAFMKQTP